MLSVKNISTDPLQAHKFILPSGESVSMTFYFMPMQYGWFIQSLVYNNVEIRGLRITNHPNMLYQFKNILPFGLACFSKDDREPSFIGDFSTGASSLYITTGAEVREYEDFLND